MQSPHPPSSPIDMYNHIQHTQDSSNTVLLTKYSKILGSMLAKGFNKFTSIFRNGFHPPRLSQEEEENKTQQSSQLQQIKKESKSGKILNFNQFKSTDSQIDAIEAARAKKQKQPTKPVRRAFAFKMEDYKDQFDNQSQSEQIDQFLTRVSSKRVKRQHYQVKNESIAKNVIKESSQNRDHFASIYNRVRQEVALEFIDKNQKKKEQMKMQINGQQLQRNYQLYIDNMDCSDFMSRYKKYEDPRKMLSNIKRLKNERLQQKPPRKIIHTESQTPQIYNVGKVLEILEQQSNQFLNQKIKKRQEEIRIQELQKIQQQKKEQLRLEEEQRQKERILLAEKQKQTQQEANVQGVSNQIQNIKSGQAELEVIQQDNSAQQHSFGLIQKKQRKSQISPKSIELSPQVEESIEIKPNQVVVAQAPKEVAKELEVQKNQEPSDRGTPKKNPNPFIRNSPAQAVGGVQSFISSDSKFQPFASLLSGTQTNPFQTINPSTPNIFMQKGKNPQEQNQSKQQPQINQNIFSSPSNKVSSNQGQGAFQPSHQGSGGGQFTHNPIINNPRSIFPGSNPTPSFQQKNPAFNMGVGLTAPPIQPSVIGAQISQPIPSSLPSSGPMFTHNPQVAKIFENNIFNNPTQPKSLFGDLNSQPAPYNPSRNIAGGRKKGQQRIS